MFASLAHSLVIAIGVSCSGPVCNDVSLGDPGTYYTCIENIKANAGKVGGAYCTTVANYLRERNPIELRK